MHLFRVSLLKLGSVPSLMSKQTLTAKEKYKDTLENLVELTHDQVGIPNTRDAQITSMVTLMAQRVVPNLKIQGSIE